MYGVTGTGSATTGGAAGEELGARAARARALAVLRVRGRALGLAVLPAAVAVVLYAGGATGHLTGPGWDTARWLVTALAVVVLLVAAAVALVVARSRPAVTPTVELAEKAAPDLYRMVRDLADRLGVPAPSAIALTPDCDSWLEDRSHRAHGAQRTGEAPVLVIGSPFLWWMRVAELRAVLAPVVAGTGPAAHPDIAAARRFVRGLDAAVAVPRSPRLDPVRRLGAQGVGRLARIMLAGCRGHAAEMERGVAAAGSERAQAVDYGVRIVAQEQVGLAYAGWDRLLTRVALPAWRMGRWPARLDAGVVSALTELSRRDRLADGFASRLGERPACDLLEEPGAVDEATSLLAARLFHGVPAEPGPDWAPVEWSAYAEEVVDRKWRADAARLHQVLDRLGASTTPPGPAGAQSTQDAPTLAWVMDHLTTPRAGTDTSAAPAAATPPAGAVDPAASAEARPGTPAPVPGAPGTAGPVPGLDVASAGTDPETAAPVPDAPASPAGPTDPAALAEAGPEAPAPVPGAAGTAGPGAGPAGTDPGTAAPAPEAAASAEVDSEALAPAPAAPASPAGPTIPAALAEAGPETPPAASGTAGPVPGPDAVPAEPGPGSGTPAPASPAEAADASDLHLHLGPDSETASGTEVADVLAAALTAQAAREEGMRPVVPAAEGPDGPLPLFPLQPPRTGRDLLADHVAAMVCCAAVDTADAAPGLDWLDGPALLVRGERSTDLVPAVLCLVEDGDPEPLRAWLHRTGVRPEKPVRLL
ncbi:hypothetical protein [Streptomyces sp. NPDC048623]|uniref:hypothetical protein n=1 Tax=Streptomyces sp. NPDC048623 TaxID=3155761 RepID=UPI00343251AA